MDQSILKYVPASKREAIRDAYRDQDGIWITLKDGWEASRTDSGCHVIHEDTIRDLKYQIAGIQRQEATRAATAAPPAAEAPEAKQDYHRTTEAQRKAVSAWVKSRDSIVLRVPKETGAEIRAAAKAAGMTVTAYILACINQASEVD